MYAVNRTQACEKGLNEIVHIKGLFLQHSNIQKVKTTQMDKQIVVHPYNGILFSLEKE